MKFKRIISLVVLVCIIGTSFFTGIVSAEQKNNIQNATQEALGLMNALGIIESLGDGSEEDIKVTRAQFSVYLANILGITASNAGDVERYFKDVPLSDRAAYAIAKLYERGIVNGTGDLNFSPNDLVTPYHAAIMLTRCLYKEDYINLVGGYDNVIAQNKILPEIAGNVITIADAAEMIYNALNMSTVYYDGYNYTKNEDENFYQSLYNIYEVEGIVNSAEGISIIDSFNTKDNEIVIGNELYETEISNLNSYIGYSVTAYVRDNGADEVDTVVYCIQNKINEVVEFSFEDFESISKDFIVTYYIDGTNRKDTVKLTPNVKVIKNGTLVTKNITDAFKEKQGNVKLISNNSSDYSVAIITAYDSAFVTMVDYNNESIYLKNMNPIMYKDYDRIRIYNQNGEIADFSAIKKNVVLTIYKSDKNLEIYIDDTQVSGVIKVISDDKIVIGESEYKVVPEYMKEFLEKAKVGVNGNFYLNKFHEIVYVSFPDNDMRWGYLTWVSEDDSEGVAIKILEDNSNITVFKVAERILIDGKVVASSAVINKFRISGKTEHQIIKYKVNAEGAVNGIYTINSSELSDGILQKTSMQNRRYYSGTHSLGFEIPMTNETIIFNISDDEKLSLEKRFIADNVFSENTYYRSISYSDSENDLYPDVVIIERETADTLIAGDGFLHMVASKPQVYYDNSDEMVKIRMDLAGKFLQDRSQRGILKYTIAENFNVSEEDKKKGYVSYEDVGEGDLVYIIKNTYDEISKIQMVFDFSEQKEFPQSGLMDVDNESSYKRITAGYAHDMQGDLLSYGLKSAAMHDRFFIDSNFQYFIVMVYDSTRKEGDRVYMGSIEDAITYKQTGNFGSGLVMQHRQLNPHELFIYKYGFDSK